MKEVRSRDPARRMTLRYDKLYIGNDIFFVNDRTRRVERLHQNVDAGTNFSSSLGNLLINDSQVSFSVALDHNTLFIQFYTSLRFVESPNPYFSYFPYLDQKYNERLKIRRYVDTIYIVLYPSYNIHFKTTLSHYEPRIYTIFQLVVPLWYQTSGNIQLDYVCGNRASSLNKLEDDIFRK